MMTLADERIVGEEKLGNRLLTLVGTLEPEDRVDVIVRLAHKIDLSPLDEMTVEERRRAMRPLLEEQARAAQTELRGFLLTHGGRRLRSLWLSNALAVNVPVGLVRELAGRPDVASVVLDAKVRLPSERVGRPAAAAGAPQRP